ncbi:sigma intracellular receptor 2-like [Dysidea avara]|uniref:sigma intracellular receptor 2-like n=1 Tax=Dysidea avara TaxID=196820 RepID=UPI003329D209
MTSIWKRPLDLLIVAIFVIFLAIAATIDYIQSMYGAVLREPPDMTVGLWPPSFFLEYFLWWCDTVDPLLGHNPVWYETMALFSPCIYLPFYIVAIYAIVTEKEWIRIPCLCWAYGLLLTMIVIVREELYGEYPTKNVTLFAMAYGGYLLMPITIFMRMIQTPLFSKNKTD